MMFGSTKTKLIIVCDEKTRDYANFLRQLISANDDTEGSVVGVADGSVEAAVWLDKDYLHNSATISSNEHVLFIGDNKVSKSEVSSMIPRFNQFGMKFGWLGKRGMMQVDDKLLNEEQYNGFLDYCMEYKEQLQLQRLAYTPSKKLPEKTTPIDESQVIDVEPIEETDEPDQKPKEQGLIKAGAVAAKAVAVAAAVMSPIGAAGTAVGVGAYKTLKGLSAMSMHKRIKDQQYRALTVILYMEGLNEFLEG